MEKKKRVKKRTRLIALLSALATLAVGGIGTGVAFSAMAATRKQGSSASSVKVSGKLKPGRLGNEVLASGNKSVVQQTTGLSVFNASAQLNNQYSMGNLKNWNGKTFNATISLGNGVALPISAPIGLWNSSQDSFVNPNTLTPGQLEETMLDGDYMGAIGLYPTSAHDHFYSFLGGVDYQGNLNSDMASYLNNSNNYGPWTNLNMMPESMQYMFQDDCNNSEILSNPYFSSMTQNTVSYLQTLLKALFFGTGKNGEPLGMYNADEAYYGTIPDKGVSSDLANLKSEADGLIANIGDYKTAMAAYSAAMKAGKSAADARSAYLNSLKGTVGLDSNGGGGKYQPLLCLAVWDQNVGYTSFPSEEAFYSQGEDKTGDAYSGYGTGSGYYPYSVWGYGPSYEGTSDASDSVLGMQVSSTATDFLYDVLEQAGYGSGIVTNGIYLTAYYYLYQTPSSDVYSKNGAPVAVKVTSTGGSTVIGTQATIHMNSLGFAGYAPNPTALPSGVTLSATSPTSDGLYFKAVSQSGEPLKSAEMELEAVTVPSGTGWEGLWFMPTGKNSAPSDVTPDIWPTVGDKFWITYDNGATSFTADSLSSQPGWFDFSGVPEGVYQVKILSGTTESGKTVSYGSYYTAPTFQIDAENYTSPETITASSDPCGFVDPVQDEVVVGASNPSSSITQGAASPKSGTQDPWTATVGSSNPFTYQAEAYMPFDLSGQGGASSTPLTFTLSSLPKGETLNQGSVEVNGKSLSSLGITPSSSSSSGVSFALSPADIASIGSQGGTIDVTFTAYLDPSFTSPASPKYEFAYKAYGAANSGNSEEDLSAVSTNGPADNSVPSTLTTSAPSSSTGLWFKDLNADGSASKGAKFLVQNSNGDYLEEDKSSSGAFSGWTWTSSASSALEFSQRNASAVFSFGGLQDGTYTVTEVSWPDSIGTSGKENTGEQNWPGISPDLPAGGPDWAGYPGHLGGKAGYNGSFQVTLSYSSPEAMSTQADPAGLVDSSKDSIYAFAPVKMAPMNGNSLSTQAYQTETVGIPFTEGWEGYLPMAVTSPTTTAGQNGYASELEVSFPENGSGLNNNGNSSGLEMSNPSPSNIEVAGVPLSTLVSNGASVSTSNSDYSITLPYKALEYLEDNGKNAAGDSISSSSNRLIIISFPAVMQTSFKNGGQFQQWMALGSGWWNQSAGSGWGVYSSPLYTNGPADNSVPSSLSPSENSSQTGIWFKSLWFGTTTPATGSKYTVQNASGEYLTPVTNSSGTFTGWSYSKTPYDFTEQNSSAVFSFGGLADGDYTLTQVDPAKGATPSSLSFTSTLSYPSPQSLKAVKDSLNLLDSSKDTVWAMVVPSSLPFTGGKMILLVSLSAVTLFGAGAIFFILRKRRRA